MFQKVCHGRYANFLPRPTRAVPNVVYIWSLMGVVRRMISEHTSTYSIKFSTESRILHLFVLLRTVTVTTNARQHNIINI